MIPKTEIVQNFAPLKQICAHLNAFHVYASDTSRCVEANHYCSHLNEGYPSMPSLCVDLFTNRLWSDVRQCLIYDTPEPNARLIGVEYMISGTLYKTLDAEERKLWHSHVFEVKSGMLILPGPEGLPQGVWEAAETKEMEQVVGLYGKTYHFWQVDRGDELPLGQPQLMISFTEDAQLSGFKEKLIDRNERFSVDCEAKKAKRSYIAEPEIHGGEYYMLANGCRCD